MKDQNEGTICQRLRLSGGTANLPEALGKLARMANEAGLDGFHIQNVEWGIDIAQAERELSRLPGNTSNDAIPTIPVYITLTYRTARAFKRDESRRDKIAQAENKGLPIQDLTKKKMRETPLAAADFKDISATARFRMLSGIHALIASDKERGKNTSPKVFELLKAIEGTAK